MVLIIALVLLVLFDIWIKSVVAQPNIILRNEGPRPMAVPYLLEQMERDKGVSIAWAGSSVLQGVNCTTAKTTAPILVQKLLREKGLPVTSYNLSFAGNVIADNYCLSHASINHKADIVVFELVFGLLLGRGAGFQNAKAEFIYYLKDLPDFIDVRNNLMMTNGTAWKKHAPYLAIKNRWALLRHKEVILYHFTGRFEDPSTQIGDKLMLRAGMPVVRQGHRIYANLPREKNINYYWKGMTAHFINAATTMFKNKMSRLNLTPSDPKMRMVARACWEGKMKNTPVLFYFAPLNREALVEHDSMDWEIYDKYRIMVTAILKEQGCDLLDLTDSVESKYFTDSQHMNMNGHSALAKALLPPLVELVNKENNGE